ncbi:response regulator [Candidatus Saccharibacteria bacterium]|nr:response regulator [Candidatus Saccharibacteria bacterium]
MAYVLLIEPDKLLADVCSQFLVSAGHKVIWRQTAEQGINALDEQKINIVILEIQLAVHNGIEFLYEMRSYSEWLDIPVIAHTHASRIPEFDNALKQLNVIKWLYKPQTSLELLAKTVDVTLKNI